MIRTVSCPQNCRPCLSSSCLPSGEYCTSVRRISEYTSAIESISGHHRRARVEYLAIGPFTFYNVNVTLSLGCESPSTQSLTTLPRLHHPRLCALPEEFLLRRRILYQLAALGTSGVRRLGSWLASTHLVIGYLLCFLAASDSTSSTFRH